MTEQNDIADNKALAAIGYLGPLCLLPLLLKTKSPFAQHHGKQGLVIFIAWIILWVVNIIPILGQFIWFVGSIVLLIYVILGIRHALEGNMWQAPFLGKFTSQIKL